LIDLVAGRPVVVRDADGLIKSAAEHRMTGLLLDEVRSGRMDLPASHQRFLAASSLATRAHHQRLWRAFEAVTDRLVTAEYNVAMAKGVGAEARWYDAPGQRPCGDLDLMLDPAQVPHVSGAVAALQSDHELLPHLDDLATSGKLQSVDILYDGVHIDLHFDILKLGIPVRQNDVIWGRTEQLQSPGGHTVRVLDAEASLVLFLLHLLKDRFSYLLGFVDVLHVLDRADIDWEFVDAFVRQEGLENLVYEALETVHETLGLASPVHPDVPGWQKQAWRALWPEAIRLDGHAGRIAHHRRQFWIPMLMSGRRWDGIKATATLAFPPRALMDHYHPDTTGPYLWRLAVGRTRRRRERRQSIERRRDES
jgi:hypothetical protein